MGPVITYATPKDSDEPFQSFVDWKFNSYINPGLELIVRTREYEFMMKLMDECIPIALVHPKGDTHDEEEPQTLDKLVDFFNDPYEMSCMPYVVAYSLLM